MFVTRGLLGLLLERVRMTACQERMVADTVPLSPGPRLQDTPTAGSLCPHPPLQPCPPSHPCQGPIYPYLSFTFLCSALCPERLTMRIEPRICLSLLLWLDSASGRHQKEVRKWRKCGAYLLPSLPTVALILASLCPSLPMCLLAGPSSTLLGTWGLLPIFLTGPGWVSASYHLPVLECFNIPQWRPLS